MFVTVREDAFEEGYVLKFCGGKGTHRCDREDQEWRWRQITPMYIWFLELAVKRLHCVNCLNA